MEPRVTASLQTLDSTGGEAADGPDDKRRRPVWGQEVDPHTFHYHQPCDGPHLDSGGIASSSHAHGS